MLTQLYSLQQLETLLLPRSSWQPFPTIENRAGWESLPEWHRRLRVAEGESYLNYAYPPLPATLFLQFARNGNRRNYEIPSFDRRRALHALVLAECIENQGRFLDDITNGIWAICEESFWGVPAHIGAQSSGRGLPDSGEVVVDLFAAETAALLAWTDYLLGVRLSRITAQLRPRIQHEINARILTPCLERDDYSWMGNGLQGNLRRVNNWNPWICSNWLACVLLMEADAARRVKSVQKIMQTVDHFIDPYPKDGGCDEGPGYWGRAGASLFDTLELLYSASNGKLTVYDQPLIQEIGRFIHRVQIADNYYINFADAPALVTPDATIVYLYGQRIRDAEMSGLGEWLWQRQLASLRSQDETSAANAKNAATRDVAPSMARTLRSLFAPPPENNQAAAPLPQDSWLPEIEVMVARDAAGAKDGLFVAAKGGNNNESHNHNDIGNFVIFNDGKPVMIDAGVEFYTAKTFGPQRYEIWTMQSAYHTLLPTIDGVQQSPGEQFKATQVSYHADAVAANFSLDLAPAYPAAAHVQSWQRNIRLQRRQDVLISDRYALNKVANEITLAILTPCAVDLAEPGIIRFGEREIVEGRQSGMGQFHYPADVFTASCETIEITDDRLRSAWGSALQRIILRSINPAQQGSWTFRFVSS